MRKNADELRETLDDGVRTPALPHEEAIDHAADSTDNTRSRLLVSGAVMLASATGLALAGSLGRGSLVPDLVPTGSDGRDAIDIRGWMQLGALAELTLAGVLGYGAASSFRTALPR